MLTIRLLGTPCLERDGRVLPPPRGRKAWALLCHLLLVPRPAGRQRVAELLFGEADDPLGALRWSLAELRRALGDDVRVGGDPLVLDVASAVEVDVIAMLADHGATTAPLDPGGDLLEGMDGPSSAAFEGWLLVERHRVSAAIVARMRQSAIAALATGRSADAVPYAARAVARDPLDEGNHELLVRALAMAGDRPSALRQVAACEDLFRRELGTTPSAALREAATVPPGSPSVPALRGRSAVLSQLEAGRAAIAAGAADAGVECLRRALAEAESVGDTTLRARAALELGSGLVHAVRGRDEEGAVVLREAIELATRIGDRAIAARAHRELGFVEVQAGRRSTADAWLAGAQALADSEQELAAVLGVRGMNASDQGDYPVALAHLVESVDRAAACDDRRQQAWSASILGRAHLLRGELAQAEAALTSSLALVREQRWVAFQPWPQALLGELRLRSGDTGRASEDLEQAWALACQVGDPCWEGMAGRGMGLWYAAQGEIDAAGRWLSEAATRSARVTDRYQWVHAHVLDSAIGAAFERGDRELAASLTAVLLGSAARGDMRELVVRAQLHRARLGDRAALPLARTLAADIDNPALAAQVGAAAGPARSPATR